MPYIAPSLVHALRPDDVACNYSNTEKCSLKTQWLLSQSAVLANINNTLYVSHKHFTSCYGPHGGIPS
jgi:hypothetical protein